MLIPPALLPLYTEQAFMACEEGWVVVKPNGRILRFPVRKRIRIKSLNRLTSVVPPPLAVDALSRMNSGTRSGATRPRCRSLAEQDSLSAFVAALGLPEIHAIMEFCRRRFQPLGQTKTFSYDSEGNLTSQTDPKGQTLTLAYDAVGQLTTKTLLPNTTNAESISFTYSSVGNMLSAEDADSRLVFTYDLISNQRKEIVVGGGTFVQHGVQAEKSYDPAGNRLTIAVVQGHPANNPAAGQVAFNLGYGYDDLNRLTNVNYTEVNQTSATVARYSYDSLSRRTSLLLDNGTTAAYQYNNASELTSLVHRKSDGTEIAQSAYAYDPLGNRTNLTNTSGVHDFSYDALNRLIRASHPPTPAQPTETFSYDSVGNRLTSHLTPTPSATYDSANRLVSNSSFTYTYDANGNLTSKTDIITSSVTAYQYDPENRLTRVNLPDGTFESYRYDALGRRIEKNSNGTIRRFIYDGEYIVLELDSTGFPTAKFVHGPGIDEPILITKDQNGDSIFAGDERFFYHADGLGSIVKMTNPSASVVNSYDYDSFGQIISQIETIPQPYKFTGREFDPATGKYFYRAREYDPFSGRFGQEDPILFRKTRPQQLLAASIESYIGADEITRLPSLPALWKWNAYAYVRNNPVNLTDPSGLQVSPGGGGTIVPFSCASARFTYRILVKNLQEAQVAAKQNPCPDTFGHVKKAAEAVRDFLNSPAVKFCIAIGLFP